MLALPPFLTAQEGRFFLNVIIFKLITGIQLSGAINAKNFLRRQWKPDPTKKLS